MLPKALNESAVHMCISFATRDEREVSAEVNLQIDSFEYLLLNICEDAVSINIEIK